MSTQIYEDKVVKCIGFRGPCENGGEFVLTAGEQDYFATKVDQQTGRHLEPPKRCPACRKKKKEFHNGNHPFEEAFSSAGVRMAHTSGESGDWRRKRHGDHRRRDRDEFGEI